MKIIKILENSGINSMYSNGDIMHVIFHTFCIETCAIKLFDISTQKKFKVPTIFLLLF